jgi:NAD(P)-dependent dehydrogenase (short-subunit alcohol dehydrogenase family)
MTDEFAIYPSLRGLPVVVSGGASGIGEAIVRGFAGQGSKVGFVDIAAERGRALEDELRTSGHTVRFIASDVADIPAYQAAIADFATAHGPAMALVNNVGAGPHRKMEDVTPAFWDASAAVNLRHSFFAAQAVIAGMKAARRGAIVNFGSISWMILSTDSPVYNSSKAAMHGLSRSMARELGSFNIRVNTLVPGWIMTERELATNIDDEANRMIDAGQALPGRLYPPDIARMVMFLCADDSKMITGQDFIVDGGWAHG